MAEYHKVIGIDLGTTYSVVAAYSYAKSDVKVIPNKQNEPTIAVNPVNSAYLIAGSNDEQRQPPCGQGPVRGAGA